MLHAACRCTLHIACGCFGAEFPKNSVGCLNLRSGQPSWAVHVSVCASVYVCPVNLIMLLLEVEYSTPGPAGEGGAGGGTESFPDC